MLHIEQIRPELTWRLRRDVLYPDDPLPKMEMEEDHEGYHFGAFMDNKLVAVVSLFKDGDGFQFRKLAVLPETQGQGVGRQLLNYITDFVINEGGSRIWCNARTSAIGFYAKFGFRQTGNVFTRGGIEYEIMEKVFEEYLSS